MPPTGPSDGPDVGVLARTAHAIVQVCGWERRSRGEPAKGAVIQNVDGNVNFKMRETLLDLAAEPDVVHALRIAEKLRFAAPRSSAGDVETLIGAIGDPDPLVALGALHAVAGVSRSGVDRVLVATLDDPRAWMRPSRHSSFTQRTLEDRRRL